MQFTLNYDFTTRKNQRHQGSEQFADYDSAQNRYHQLANPFIPEGLLSDDSKIVEIINGLELPKWEAPKP